ncbi:hypothetical protein F444_01381, partial [Phytophthora nicotianae P1976]
VHSASIDHADAIASAFELGFMEDIGEQHLRLLHQSRSLKQFRALSKRVVKAWKESGEDKLAEWLQNVYLTKRWERWSVNSSSVPGFLPSQQPIESHHRVIKVIVTDYKKAPTITVLNSVLPRVLLYDATNLTPEHHRHYAEELVVGKAWPISTYKRSEITFISLQQATVDRRALVQMNPLIPRSKWRFEEVRHGAKLNVFRCTCKNFMHTGWVCSHVIASLDLLNKLKIGLALQKIPMRGLPGRRRDFQGGLTRDSDPYDVDRLIQLFTKTPGKPL